MSLAHRDLGLSAAVAMNRLTSLAATATRRRRTFIITFGAASPGGAAARSASLMILDTAGRKWRVDAILSEIHNLSNFLERLKTSAPRSMARRAWRTSSRSWVSRRLYAPPHVKLLKSGGTGGRLDR
jgi:hypothetical protein